MVKGTRASNHRAGSTPALGRPGGGQNVSRSAADARLVPSRPTTFTSTVPVKAGALKVSDLLSWEMPEATPWGCRPAYLIHDRDAVYGRDFDARAGRLRIAGVRTPPRAPKANSIAERLVASIRRECLDHVVVINERHPRTVLAEFVHYYNNERPHRTLCLDSPVPHESRGHGPVVSTPVLGGLHHDYARAA